jgi:hypothetical protein
LEGKGVSFVSVTQSFNTSTSMGRLTLNVLLSFAQFERELTGERIRDKIAASKKKGMWMGGNVPLGYAAHGRTLKIVPEDGKRVRRIFERFVETASLRQVARELERERVQLRRANTERVVGNEKVWTSAVRYLLCNRIYLGEIRHHDQWHPGQHPPIVDVELFAAAQKRFEPARGPGQPTYSPLRGLVFDDAGFLMSPTYAEKKGRRYRYYVSRADLRAQGEQAGSLARISAPAFEKRVSEIVGRFLGTSDQSAALAQVLRVIISAESFLIELKADALDPVIARARLTPGETIDFDDDVARVQAPTTVRPWRGAKHVFDASGRSVSAGSLDGTLVQAIARAHAWRREWLAPGGPTLAAIARIEGLDLSYLLRMVRLAYLAPDLVRAALAGSDFAFLSIGHVTHGDLPLDWDAQKRIYLRAS